MSDHVAKTKPADDPAFKLPAGLAGLTLPLLVGGLILLLAGYGLTSARLGSTFAMSSYMAALMYWVSIAIGCLFFVLVQHLCRAGWSVVVRRVAELVMVMIIPLAILFIPVLISLIANDDVLYMWDNPNFVAEHGVPQSSWDAKSLWLNSGWFTFRSILYFLIWGGLAVWYFRGSRTQDETGEKTITERMQARSGPAIIAFAFCTSFASFDWIMSLAPMWFSTMFGVYFFTGGILSAHCIIALLTFIFQKKGALRDEVTVEHYHDLGKFIFGFICFWGYIGFSQFMLIWYANIPEETHWYDLRSHGGWAILSLFLIVAHFIVPFLAIMSRHVRRRPALVALVSIYVLIVHFVDVYWMVVPQAGHHGVGMGVGGAAGAIGSLLCVLGMSGLMLGLILKVASQTKLMAVRDPRLQESLSFHNI